jgi:hypothetical protein
MRAGPLDAEADAALVGRFVRVCLEHVAPLDEGMACPMRHPRDAPRQWFVYDNLKRRVVGGINDNTTDKDEGGRVGAQRPILNEGELMAKLAQMPMTVELKDKIREMHARGVPRPAIAEQLGLGYQQVYWQTQPTTHSRTHPPSGSPARKAPAARPWAPPRKEQLPKLKLKLKKAPRAKVTKAVVVAKRGLVAIPSLPNIKQDLRAHKDRLLGDLRNVERAIEALELVEQAWAAGQ